jgi:cell division protein ZapA (FtsZ GTPase activity inhibitor)
MPVTKPNELAKAAPPLPQNLATLSTRPEQLQRMLDNMSAERKILSRFVDEQMVEGTDYGVIPGTKNRTLLKPGGEKLIDLFRCTPRFKLIKDREDFDKGFFHYIFRCQLVQRDSEVVIAEGFGSCNSHEGKYRYRNAQRICPACNNPTIIKGKEEYGGGWVCFKKKGGCGTKFEDGDPAIEGQAVGQTENPDVADQANTILKMAKKRAMIDGAISMARCSELFTQDLDDQVESVHPQTGEITKVSAGSEYVKRLAALKTMEEYHALVAEIRKLPRNVAEQLAPIAQARRAQLENQGKSKSQQVKEQMKAKEERIAGDDGWDKPPEDLSQLSGADDVKDIPF